MASEDDVTGPINLANPRKFTMLVLAQQVIELIGSSSKLVFHPLRLDDPRQRQPDITRAKSDLGWDVSVSLSERLVQTIDYFRGIGASDGN